MSSTNLNNAEQPVPPIIPPTSLQPGSNQVSRSNIPSGGLSDRLMSDVLEGQQDPVKIAKWRRKCKFMIEEEERLRNEKEAMEFNKMNFLQKQNYKIQKKYSKLKGHYLYDIPFEFIKSIVMYWILINFK